MPKDSTGPKPHTVAREAELLALMPEMRTGLDQVEAAKALVKKAQNDYAVVRAKVEIQGFTLEIIDKALKLERQPKNRRGQQQVANEEYFVFKTLGLPVALPPNEMDFGSDEERDEAYWGDQGYQAGIRGDIAKPPSECPPHLHQTWLNRRAAGSEYSAWGKSEAGAKPDQGGAGVVTTIDAARARKGQAPAPDDDKGETDEPDESTTKGGRPKGALEKDPLLQGAPN
jgi:hypothetical protein